MTRSNAVGFGGVLGFCNTALISLLIGPASHTSYAIGFFVFMFGIIAALITGMTLGALADATSRYNVWLRLGLIAVPAVAVLLGMAVMFDLGLLFLPAVIPTVVSALLLERRTRYRSNVPVVRVVY